MAEITLKQNVTLNPGESTEVEFEVVADPVTSPLGYDRHHVKIYCRGSEILGGIFTVRKPKPVYGMIYGVVTAISGLQDPDEGYETPMPTPGVKVEIAEAGIPHPTRPDIWGTKPLPYDAFASTITDASGSFTFRFDWAMPKYAIRVIAPNLPVSQWFVVSVAPNSQGRVFPKYNQERGTWGASTY